MNRAIDDVRDVRNLIQHLDPAPSEVPDNLSLRSKLTTLPEDTAPARRGLVFAGHRRPVTWGVVAAAVLVVAGLAYHSVGDSPSSVVAALPATIHLGRDEPAAGRLEELAANAEARGGQSPGPGQSWYRRAAGWGLNTAVSGSGSVSTPTHAVSEEWRGVDGRELRRSTYVEGVEAEQVTQVSVDARPPADLPLEDLSGQGMFEVPQLAATAEDALRLLDQVYAGAPEPYRTFGGFEGLVGSQPLTGGQLAAIYRRLAALDGVDYRGEVHDRAGRVGDAYSVVTDYHGGPEEHILIVDPATGEPLGLETVQDDQVTSYVVFLESRVVPSP